MSKSLATTRDSTPATRTPRPSPVRHFSLGSVTYAPGLWDAKPGLHAIAARNNLVAGGDSHAYGPGRELGSGSVPTERSEPGA